MHILTPGEEKYFSQEVVRTTTGQRQGLTNELNGIMPRRRAIKLTFSQIDSKLMTRVAASCLHCAVRSFCHQGSLSYGKMKDVSSLGSCESLAGVCVCDSRHESGMNQV